MRHRSPLQLVLVLVGALSLLLAACGDDDDTAADDPAAETDGAESGTDDADVEEATEDAAEGEIDAAFGGDCAFLSEFAGYGFEEGFDPTEALSGGDAGETFSLLAEQFSQVADDAPDEIEADFRTLADGMGEFADAFEGIDFSDPASIDPEAMASLEELSGEASAEFEAAGEAVSTWIQENCEPQG